MTPLPDISVVATTSWWSAYGTHLREELTSPSPFDHLMNAGVVAATGWLAWVSYEQASLLGAVAVGVMVASIGSAVTTTLIRAAAHTLAARPWYGVGRTVRHSLLGECRVLDHDTRPETGTTWVLIQPQYDAARWVPVSTLHGVIRIELSSEEQA